MKKLACQCALMMLFGASVVWAAESEYIVRGDKVYRVQDGKERLLEDEVVFRAETDAGKWAWVLVDPELSEGVKGSESGVYFFRGEEDAPASFLPMKNAGECMMEFSPSGEKLLICCGDEARQDLGYYVLDDAGKGWVRKASFVSAGHAFWVDQHRFVFTAIDTEKGPRTKAGDDWWCSPSLYDTLEKELTVIIKATSTKNYFIGGCDDEGGSLDINESSVKNPKDWGNENKIKYKELTVPIPAAG